MRLENVRVLVVEDSPTQRMTISGQLKAEGATVELAETGDKGWERFISGSFDIVLSDVVMPGMSGFDLCRKIKEDSRGAHVPVALITSLSDAANIVTGLTSGADNFITKPYQGTYLIDRICRMLEERIANAEAKDKVHIAAEIKFMGSKIRISAGKTQILSLLVTAFEETVLKSREIEVKNTVLEQEKIKVDVYSRRLEERTIQLESANSELESFSYSVAHDLRAPLRAINGFSQAVLEDYADKLDDEGRDSLGRIRAASQRMGLLIDDLLNLSRISRTRIKNESLNLSSLAESCVNTLRETEPNRLIEVVIQPGLNIEADSSLMRIVMTNMLGNAWKFTRKTDKARIEIGVMDNSGQKVYFVRDNGAGFDQSHADKLFVAFQRLHSTEEYEGTGIGLATISRIVHLHGGKVWAEGKPGEGATFYFTIRGDRHEQESDIAG
jgi:signal transduction histidine kinase